MRISIRRNRQRHEDFTIPSSKRRSKEKVQPRIRSRSRTKEKRLRKEKEWNQGLSYKTGFSPFKNPNPEYLTNSIKKKDSATKFLDFASSNMFIRSKERSNLLLSFEKILQSSSSKKYKNDEKNKKFGIGNIREFEMKEEEEVIEKNHNHDKCGLFCSPLVSKADKFLKESLQSTKDKRTRSEMKIEEGQESKMKKCGKKRKNAKKKVSFQEDENLKKSSKQSNFSHNSIVIFDNQGGFYSGSELIGDDQEPLSLGGMTFESFSKLELKFAFGEDCKKFDDVKQEENERNEYLVNLSSILKYSENEQIKLAKRQKARYVCKYCGQVFTSGCALGGHVSKIHRGVSLKYKKKQMNRREKRIERQRTKFFKSILQ